MKSSTVNSNNNKQNKKLLFIRIMMACVAAIDDGSVEETKLQIPFDILKHDYSGAHRDRHCTVDSQPRSSGFDLGRRTARVSDQIFQAPTKTQILAGHASRVRAGDEW